MIRAFIVGVIACQGACVIAQDLLWATSGTFGRKLGLFKTAGVGDVDHDGHEDVMAIVHGACGQGGTGNWIWLLSGQSGALIREIPVAWPIPGGGSYWRVAPAGDWNDDGTPDYAVTGVLTEVRSGTNDAVLLQSPWAGSEVLGDIDVDGDGLEDLVVGGWWDNAYWGGVRVYSHGGQELYRLSGTPNGPQPLAIANSLANLGDIDDDGCDDFVMGCFEPTGVGAAVVVSGKRGKYHRVCLGTYPLGGIGYDVDACGDVDGDGYQDFIVGNGGTSFVPFGIVDTFSARTGTRLRQTFDPIAPSHADFSKSIASRGVDLDGDGVADWIAGSPTYYTGTNAGGAVYSFSGRDGSLLHRNSAPHPMCPTSNVGYWATILRPPTGQHVGSTLMLDFTGCPIIVNGCLHSLGSIRAYRGIPRTSQILGAACAGNLAISPNVGAKSIPNGVRVHVGNAPPNVAAVLAVGLSTTSFGGLALPAPLDPLGFPGCALLTSIEVSQLCMTGTQGIDAGYAFADLPYPVPLTGNGTLWLSAQWIVLGDAATFPGGVTQAIRWRH